MKIRQIRKRDGQLVPFDKTRISDAIFKAAQSVGGSNRVTAEFLADKVIEVMERTMPFGAVPNVEDIQDVVEKVLIEEGHAKTAKAYILYRNEHAKIREEQKKILNGKTTKLPFSMNALQVVAKRYLVHDREGGVIESPEEMFFRVANTLAEVEYMYGKKDGEVSAFKNDFLEIMSKFEFIPAGRTLANAGAPTPIVPNCVVLHMEDSMDGIFQTLREASLLQQAGCGLGFPFHLLRPAGTIAKKSRGVASGPVSFLKVYNTSFGVIKQQNRHGANMGVMRVDHPDILEFVHAKDIEGDVNNFNISVGLTNDFMEKIQKNDPSPWLCEWNGEKMKPRRVYRDAHSVVIDIKEETMTARELFQEIISSAWKTGEPGCVFLDKVNETNPLPGLGRIEACNPCVTGDTLVSTEHGLMRMKALAERYGDGGLKIVTDNRIPTEVHHSDGTITLLYRKMGKGTSLNEISAAFKTGIKPVWKLTTDFGYELEATADHKIMTADGWVRMENLTSSHKVLLQSDEGKFTEDDKIPLDVENIIIGKNSHKYVYKFPTIWSKELGQVLGWLIGDGWLRDKEKEWAVGFTFGKNDADVFSYLKPIIDGFYGNEIKEMHREKGTIHLIYGSKDFASYMKKLGIKHCKAEEKCVPESIFTATRDAVIGFLQGLFSADGTVRDNPKSNSSWIALASKSENLLKGVQVLLLNLGIKSKIYNRSRAPRKSVFRYVNKKGEKKEYACDGILFELAIFGESREFFKNKIGFIQKMKNERLANVRFKKFYKNDYTDRVKKIGYVGEKEVYDLTEPSTHSMVCNSVLLHQCGEQFLHDGDVCNLGSINLEKFVVDGKIDFDRLRHVTRLAVRMLDNVIDLTYAPVDKVNLSIRSNRRVGLGIMGFADMLYQLHVPYNSDEGFKTAEKVMKCVQDAAHEMSRELAEEKGTFPNWDKSVYKQKGVKMRNAALTNIAPTGTISMVFDVSGGVEPYFALAYHYQGILGGNTQLFYINKHLKKALEKYDLYNNETMRKINEEGTLSNIPEIPEELKRVFVTAMDISSEDHTRMQASFQKYCDNAISKTVNFHEDATKEDVLQGYILAWQLGCKGCTVYRNNSRNVQVLNLNKKKEPVDDEMQKELIMKAVSGGGSESMKECPDCAATLEFKEGCVQCPECGWGKCSV